MHGHATTLLHHRLLPSTLHHPHLPLLLLLLLHVWLLLLLLLLLHVWLLAHAQVSKISRPSPLGSPAGLLPHVKNQPRDEAQILLLGLGSHEHLALHVRCWFLCWVPTLPDRFLQFPDKTAAKNLRLPLLGSLLAHVVHPTNVQNVQNVQNVKILSCRSESSNK